MARDRQTTWVLVAIVVIAIIGILFAGKQGGWQFLKPVREMPYAYEGDCCTCTRTLMSGFGGVKPGTSETLFKNVVTPSCVALCTEVNRRTKYPGFEYTVSATVSNDPVCDIIKPVPLPHRPQPTAPTQRVGAGAYRSSPAQGMYE